MITCSVLLLSFSLWLAKQGVRGKFEKVIWLEVCIHLEKRRFPHISTILVTTSVVHTSWSRIHPLSFLTSCDPKLS